jgi:hypothetical protein
LLAVAFADVVDDEIQKSSANARVVEGTGNGEEKFQAFGTKERKPGFLALRGMTNL